jgi:glucose/arabinose dehydrogenase
MGRLLFGGVIIVAIGASLGLRDVALDPSVATGQEQLSLAEVAAGLSQPVGVTHAGDERLFIVERGGLIRVYNGSGVLPTPFLSVSSLLPTSPGQEEGLLGLAFHPDYPSTPHFFIHYTNSSGDVVIARYAVSENPNVADAGSSRVLMTIPHPSHQNHNGGQLAFGPDGYLYAAVGDGGGSGDPGSNAQDLNDLLGKILRIDVDQNLNTPPYYGIPPSNPFADATPAWTRSGHRDCGIPGVSVSTARPVTSSSPTLVRAIGKRSTLSQTAARVA